VVRLPYWRPGARPAKAASLCSARIRRAARTSERRGGGERRLMQEALFYGFNVEKHVQSDHLLRKIDPFVDLTGLRAHLQPFIAMWAGGIARQA
jgi:hypothetical protein